MNKEKKLVYVLNCVSEDDSQHFVHVFNLLRELRLRGWTVTILSEKGGVGLRTVFGQDVQYLSKSGRWFRLLRLTYYLIKLRCSGNRLVFVRISRPAALVSTFFGKLLGWKTLYWLSGTTLDFDRRKPPFRRVVDRLTMVTAVWSVDRLVTGPAAMVKYYHESFALPMTKMLLLYNDIDLNTYRPVPRARASDEPLRILLLHRLSPVRETAKYFPDILNVLSAKRRNVRVDVVGDGPELDGIKRLAARSPDLEIAFHGAVPNRSVLNWYQAADIFIMPSYREGFPRVILEAMAMALPVVSTDAGGTIELFGPLQRNYVVSRDSPSAFADRLDKLINDKELRDQLAMENQIYVQRFSSPNIADMYNQELERLIQ